MHNVDYTHHCVTPTPHSQPIHSKHHVSDPSCTHAVRSQRPVGNLQLANGRRLRFRPALQSISSTRRRHGRGVHFFDLAFKSTTHGAALQPEPWRAESRDPRGTRPCATLGAGGRHASAPVRCAVRGRCQTRQGWVAESDQIESPNEARRGGDEIGGWAG